MIMCKSERSVYYMGQGIKFWFISIMQKCTCTNPHPLPPFSTGNTVSGRGQTLALKVSIVTDVNFQLVQCCRVMPSPAVGLSLKTTWGPQSMYFNQARINCTMEIFWADQRKQNNSPSNKQLIILITGQILPTKKPQPDQDMAIISYQSAEPNPCIQSNNKLI